jgi:hypothetical protein
VAFCTVSTSHFDGCGIARAALTGVNVDVVCSGLGSSRASRLFSSLSRWAMAAPTDLMVALIFSPIYQHF